ncbi:MAG TPA: zinc ribbon domain-containing protein [Solirubrobacteraceae bacterium]|nr:zinc ribbon domain-containing protein [Solirubrobacteraceae bacterium]
MSSFGEAIGRDGGRSVPLPPPSGGPSATESTSPAAGTTAGRSELQRRRDTLADQVRELHWDLGGLAYEMAIRDHFRLDVLVRRAATLQERDGELAEVERLLRMEEGGVAGSCPHCAAPHSRGAVYCWQCGATLMERIPSTALVADEDTTAVMDALLASPAHSSGD